MFMSQTSSIAPFQYKDCTISPDLVVPLKIRLPYFYGANHFLVRRHRHIEAVPATIEMRS